MSLNLLQHYLTQSICMTVVHHVETTISPYSNRFTLFIRRVHCCAFRFQNKITYLSNFVSPVKTKSLPSMFAKLFSKSVYIQKTPLTCISRSFSTKKFQIEQLHRVQNQTYLFDCISVLDHSKCNGRMVTTPK